MVPKTKRTSYVAPTNQSIQCLNPKEHNHIPQAGSFQTKLFKIVKQNKYCIQTESKSEVNSGNASYHSALNLLSLVYIKCND